MKSKTANFILQFNAKKVRRSQNGRFQEETGGRELSFENGRLPFKTGELKHMVLCKSS